ncbi:YnbE family lipoprotein [Edwardsiella tarda]|uniref:YnbE family lipoprotein n=3 Tax=Edwardsiella tarda TaxID=636 RepID=A0A2A7U3E4_EDWTA|nr:YnbE family lipoprotein [Edwardsiella tarda]AKH89146.1 YnbE family lipoprotein [Edwardsiella tarda]ATI65757.1 YnbE family lipoprotein [Edwardsiella tarda]EFE22991.1 hypothetical protein EDWATA_01998 [Edwardsiella tarda ATCC 23685]PEH72763.1 YnbE family lipoprotein [Edwardsiella tarda]UAL55181.1 YnbE family lipoprotein [Edwardsiella tarda]
MSNAMMMGPALMLALLVTGCTPRIEVAAPTQPITINMNVKIEHDIHITLDKEVEALLKSKPGLF